MSALVETEDTVGTDVVKVQELTPDFGRPAAGSKGVVVSAPETPNTIPEAAVGVAPRFTVIVSGPTVEAAIPYHSTCVVSWAPEQETKEPLAEPCHAILPWESEIDDTVTDVPDL